MKKPKPAVQYERVCPHGCRGGVHKIGTDFFKVDDEMVSRDNFICNRCGSKTTFAIKEIK